MSLYSYALLVMNILAASENTEQEETKIRYKNETHINFSTSIIEGETKLPENLFLDQNQQITESLVEQKLDFPLHDVNRLGY